MCRKTSIHQTPDRLSSDPISSKSKAPTSNSIGDLFRAHGEEYIKIYKPSFQQIKLIRAIRVCKTPALGGHVFICKDCGHKHYVYNSCGHSHCMICQSIKREQWMDKLSNTLLQVPYIHSVFTLPHQLNGIARNNESVMYSLILRVAWLTVKSIMNKYHATPGMTSILHTFGSDMKYHIHVHALITFGGLCTASCGDIATNKWVYPEFKDKLDRYRSICSKYKKIFIQEFLLLHKTDKIKYHIPIDHILPEVEKIRWVVHSTHPTMNTLVIEKYLARYINRVAISNNRLQYLKENHNVIILYNDYQNQKTGCPAPKAFKELEPLAAIHQIMEHVLPPHFQKSRKYGLHHHTFKSTHTIPNAIRREGFTVRTLFQIITELSKQSAFICMLCGSAQLFMDIITPDKNYIYSFISSDFLKAPPTLSIHIDLNFTPETKLPNSRSNIDLLTQNNFKSTNSKNSDS